MTYVMTSGQRSRCMAAIKGKNTRPELIVRKYLFARGLRFRINNRKLPGTPDIVLKKYKTVVFVDGCFWHGHEGCRYFKLPASNIEFWKQKINLNIARDYRVEVELRLLGWRVIRIWECEIKNKGQRQQALDALYNRIVNATAISRNSSTTAGDTAFNSGETTAVTFPEKTFPRPFLHASPQPYEQPVSFLTAAEPTSTYQPSKKS